MEEKKVLYKVVRLEDRRSVVVGRKYHDEKVINKYALTYLPGTLVKAPKGSLGIFCFDELESARRFARDLEDVSSIAIIRVHPWGKEINTPPRICIMSRSFEEVVEAYKKVKRSILKVDYWYIPDGSICYQGVRVLDYFEE